MENDLDLDDNENLIQKISLELKEQFISFFIEIINTKIFDTKYFNKKK